MQLQDARRDLDESSNAMHDVASLQEDIVGLKEKVQQLRNEHKRIKEEVSIALLNSLALCAKMVCWSTEGIFLLTLSIYAKLEFK